ncbi:putative chitinase 3, partial [Stegodyphus mimosarum]
MTYDMHGPWEGKTGHHAQFDKAPSDADHYANVKSAVQIWISGGADKKKLILGIPLYGNTFTLADPKKHGIGAPAKGPGKPGPRSKQGGFIAYNEMCEFLNSGNWTEEEDKIIGFYSHNGDQWSCYDPPMMVVRKAKYVVESGLGGVLLKDLSTDDFEGNCFHMPFPLTKMARMEIIHKVKRL